MNTQAFVNRHISLNEQDTQAMLSKIGVSSIEELISQTIPADIRADKDLSISEPLSEYEMLSHSKELASKNYLFDNYIGFGYHNVILPSVIQRNILENPSWYTAYTPYQAEIAQGRLEALLNFQTVVSSLTGFPLANASLLDEGTAAAEAMHMFFENRTREQKKAEANRFFVSELVLPQTVAVLQTKAEGLGIEIVVGCHEKENLSEGFFGVLLQYPGKNGVVLDYTESIAKYKENNLQVAVACSPMALVKLKSPASMGADCAVGTTQRFGIPMGYGGPHAAFFACQESYKRDIPGRIIGVSQDMYGKRALRMALQTREQHIKREKATSNICTAQVLLAVMAGMYCVYHGPKGLEFIADQIHYKANALAESLKILGYQVVEEASFDTVKIALSEEEKLNLMMLMRGQSINLNYFTEGIVSIALNEACTEDKLQKLLDAFANFKAKQSFKINIKEACTLPKDLLRTDEILKDEVFNKYHTETELMRYIKRLERKDLSLTHSMISLGSCTMKLNAATEMLPLSWAEWGSVHPFVPTEQAGGYQLLIKELEKDLAEITGFAGTSLQPNSGAQGEYAGLMVIREYHKSRGEGHRNIVLIPQSAHGTNPASAVMAGMKVVVVKNLENGEIDFEDFKAKAEEHRENLSAVMITYPSTYGFFDANIRQITSLVHQYGGQVYMDGANMNAQVGFTSPGLIGADVCHLNLHKTFAIPHGGGGPGVGPICVAEHLVPFLPSNPNIGVGGSQSIQAISSAPYGSSLVLNISYAYIKMLGAQGLKKATEHAILNANYLKDVLKEHFPILYTNAQGRVAHECIVDFRQFKTLGIEVADVAKRLMDYGFHAPTVSFPVAGTLMIEPTESESKAELDRFAEALISIKKEIEEIANGQADAQNNVLKNAPHTEQVVLSDSWDKPYSREKAAYPLDWVREHKFFASVSRVDEAYGDRNLVCTCAPIENYM
ncbi:aminomethyl-transferring glycine dehydrogenase [Riemerella anatipestifer]|uniref:glycine dehydrogenase (aminomethyl-transferring) n=1 Tax=Riemerella anatipestifer TaxID=34085 RepID=A0AAP3AL67_RIEAN|nr:aminomethyl-transferring glycine dehydrogenase [Riemerella anatipestifer]MCW0511339.1 aminomethyl-transferring glycine dehydrogenase [Riemerella anatipestifer]MCW0519813.1 aminomethyl-transferring glycine dehydrogenase [Riemerella anatipestifer]MCW0523980.1 aminomethyl-transferring glycine dehydrogenase [Riemerella anatipestifer]MDD1539712.1 aminomethyl-transferring glycine dehydrogenase [Riemerella anatipestifer]MDR7796895.1 aminomethyl-transferring glycine dehydrogenase [Riemerella anatip